uniref:Major facilitator superfamily (MFS) profile domain-containing protein n=1 Tax=Ciona savignyi TaxID=51511 RepID=H2YS13_CIOSA
MLVGFNHVSIYSDLVFANAGIPLHLVTFATIGVFGASFVAAIFGSKVVAKFGPLKVILVTNAVIIFSIALFTVSRATSHLAPTVIPYITIVAVGVYLVVWKGGLNVALFPLLVSFTVEATRATVLAYGSVVLWSMSWMVAFVGPYLQYHLGPYEMMIWLGCALVGLILMGVFLPETKGKNSDQIQAYFKGRAAKASETHSNL